jgi:hypothetical protein
LIDILSAASEHEQQFGRRAQLTIPGIEQHAPDLHPDRRAARLGSFEYVMSGRTQSSR